jgi:mRNA-degrading endonuclease RelE of RelBE toxin-antitoxin system
MAKARRFAIDFVQTAIEHLDHIPRKHHRLIESMIDGQLAYEPEVRTRNRKPLRLPPPFGATWELRFGPDNRFRVFYSVDSAEEKVVIKGIGIKESNRLICGGEEIDP